LPVHLRPSLCSASQHSVDSTTDVPRDTEIRVGETTWLDIEIDTGIR